MSHLPHTKGKWKIASVGMKKCCSCTTRHRVTMRPSPINVGKCKEEIMSQLVSTLAETNAGIGIQVSALRHPEY